MLGYRLVCPDECIEVRGPVAQFELLHEGQTIRDTYEVERFLGSGAFAEVYRVRHRFLGRQAMKVFKLPGMTVAETEQMLAEAVMLSRIGHPNIVRVFEANVIDTSAGVSGFFTMEYVAGGTLDHFWRSFGAMLMPVETAVEVLCQACRGLAVAHGEQPPIVHRDIKPQNLLVGYETEGLRVRVSDFGLAKRVNPLTLLASAKGTRSFKAPEVFRDLQSDSCAGDVWALGCSLYLLLTDRLPYPDAATILGPSGISEAQLILPSRLNLQVDGALDQIVSRALAVWPEARYPSAQELLQDLLRWRPSPAVPPPQPSSSFDAEKTALGPISPLSEASARQKVSQATQLARENGRLSEAADLLEEALNLWPDLRDQYAYQLRLWRQGKVM